jgi:hypothetical protein
MTEVGVQEAMPDMPTRRLADIAKTIRSKNAGPDKVTFDIIFTSRADYDLVRSSGVVSAEAVCRLYNVPRQRLSNYVEFDPALAIKFTFFRERPSGSPGDPDIFGSQQYGPLLLVEVPVS